MGSPPETGDRGGDIDIVSVNVAEPTRLLAWPTGDIISSIDKRPVKRRSLELTTLNLDGDAQADTRPLPGGGQVHGGPHQAALNDRATTHPELAAIAALSPGVRIALRIRNRDLSGGVPETDAP